MTKKQYYSILVFVMLFFMAILTVVVAMNVKNTVNMRQYLRESVESQLISTSLAAVGIIDTEAFIRYNDISAWDIPAYHETLARLRYLADSVGAQYIYALKKQGDEYIFVFDTDRENPGIFIPYKLSPVHEAAFAGQESAGIMNVVDEYGAFNTGAVPLRHNGAIVGIVSTDVKDVYLKSSFNTAFWNSAMLVGILVIAMAATFRAVTKLLRHIKDMQDKLEQQALYDNVTGLPNRQYLMDHLAKLTTSPEKSPFGLLFVDLDNFKKVNDNAGHDAGDELLRQIARYLDSALWDTKSFRPAAGMLNIAARVGGDEFIQVVNGLDTHEKAAIVAQKLLDGFQNAELSRYIEKYSVGLSIGVALFPHDTENYNVLIKYADTAMYHAKHGGKNQYRIYVDEMGHDK